MHYAERKLKMLELFPTPMLDLWITWFQKRMKSDELEIPTCYATNEPAQSRANNLFHAKVSPAFMWCQKRKIVNRPMEITLLTMCSQWHHPSRRQSKIPADTLDSAPATTGDNISSTAPVSAWQTGWNQNAKTNPSKQCSRH